MPELVNKTDSVKVLRRAGVSQAKIDELLAQLPDPFDLDRNEQLLARYGVTRGDLEDRMGGSP